jgi:hypothetical protein
LKFFGGMGYRGGLSLVATSNIFREFCLRQAFNDKGGDLSGLGVLFYGPKIPQDWEAGLPAGRDLIGRAWDWSMKASRTDLGAMVEDRDTLHD